MPRKRGNFGRRYTGIIYSIEIIFRWNHWTKFKRSNRRLPPPSKTFSSTYWNQKCYHFFLCIFIEVIGGLPSSFERLCLDGGQRLENFLVGHNINFFCRQGVVEKPIKGSWIERLAPTLVGYQPARLFDHPTFMNQVVVFGRHKEKSSWIGNQKF
jgi:hypothetical protein